MEILVALVVEVLTEEEVEVQALLDKVIEAVMVTTNFVPHTKQAVEAVQEPQDRTLFIIVQVQAGQELTTLQTGEL
jgi:hypothetical protein